MKFMKRGLAVGAIVASSFAIIAGSASAALSPNPYSSTSDSGSFTSNTALGTSRCNISAINVSLSGTATGASGSVSGLTVSGCSGAITGASASLVTSGNPIGVTLSSGTVTLTNVNLLIRNILGGSCLYRGTLTGTYTAPTRSITARNSAFPLLTTLSGFCSSTADANLTVNTAATIS